MTDIQVRSVWPLLGFDPQWNESRYDFGELLFLKRLEDDERDAAAKFVFDCYASCRTPALEIENGSFVECDWQTDFRWVLVPCGGERGPQRPEMDTGVDFVAAVEEDVKDIFLRAMRVAMPTGVSAPIMLKATLRPHFALDQEATDGVSDTWPIEKTADSYSPRYYTKSELGGESLSVLQDIWPGFRWVHNLDRWTEHAFSELFFQQISEKAGKASQQGDITLLAAALNELIYPPVPSHRVVAFLEKHRDLFPLAKNEDEREHAYCAAFRLIFAEMRREFIGNRSRLGRALEMLDDGLRLPPMHTFLSACLALELLFNTESEGVTAQIALRFAKLLGQTPEEARRLDGEMRRVYGARSALVHGREAFEKIAPEDVKRALHFARLSLQRILSDDKLVRLFGEPTSNNKEQRTIRDFFNQIIFEHGSEQ